MLEPTIPPDEAQRLASLRSLELLDTPIEERFERITRVARRLFSVPTALLSLVDADRQWFKSTQGCAFRSTPRAVSFCGHAILQDEPLVVTDARRDRRFYDNPLVRGCPPLVFYAGSPIRSPDGQPIGALCLNSDVPRALSEEEISLLEDLARIAESEILLRSADATLAEVLSDLAAAHRRALLDPLTSVWNREGVCRVLDALSGAAVAGGAAVLLADVDHFKAVNDRHGHPVGDQVLQEVARRLTRAARRSDCVGRIGGEEFILCLAPPVTRAQALAIADRARRLFDGAPVPTTAGDLRVTLSIGVAAAEAPDAAAPGLLLREADQAMYRAKRCGRNRVCAAPASLAA